MKSGIVAHAAVLAVLLGTFGCTSIPADQRSESDPWEPLNRSVYNVNHAIDSVSTRPLAKGYRKVLPAPVRKGIANFFNNLLAPKSAINNFLQGKPRHGFSELGRLVINTTVGIGGLFDVATPSGLEEHREDFGQTAAVWGIPPGPYVVLPVFGPHNLRDAIFSPLDIIVDPLYQYENSSVRDKLYPLRLISLREQLLKADKLLLDSKDPYITLRESYVQNREYEIHDGDPPVEEDDFFDEFLDEE